MHVFKKYLFRRFFCFCDLALSVYFLRKEKCKNFNKMNYFQTGLLLEVSKSRIYSPCCSNVNKHA